MATPNNSLFNSSLFGGNASNNGSGILVSDLIYAALRIARVVKAAGRGPAKADVSDGFSILNAMIDAWNTERLFIYAIERDLYPVTALQQTYQIGAGAADYNVTRPIKIERASVLVNQSTLALELPLRLLDYAGWQREQVKGIQSPWPEKLYYDGNFPIATLNLWPVPTDSTISLILYVRSLLKSFNSPSDSVVFPPGYERALMYNLAVEISTRYESNISELAIDIASDAKAKLKANNVQSVRLSVDPSFQQGGLMYNWESGRIEDR